MNIENHRQGWREVNAPKPPEVDTGTPVFALLLVCVALLAMYVLGRADGAEDTAAAVRQQLIECMNGRATWSHPNATGRGYGRTMIICRGVEEIDI